jgi:transcriptional regulator of acetoin/glycerol metabolism
MSRATTKPGPNRRTRSTDTAPGETGGDRAAAVTWTHVYLIMETEWPLDGGARYCVREHEAVLFGRGADRSASRGQRDGESYVRVEVRSALASTDHAIMRRTPLGWQLEDLSSKNGTLVNGNRVVSPVIVRPGDVIQIGRAFLTIRDSVVSGDVDFGKDLSSADAESQSIPGLPTLLPALAIRLLNARIVAKSEIPVCIVGGTGSGKGVLAKALHAYSGRKGPMVTVNCPELTPTLVEGQLFGFERGAYTGAERADPGLVRSADGGTLFMDEVPDLPLPMQAKLLRVLQDGEVLSLGAARVHHVDIRVVSATQQKLESLVAEGRFRRDLKGRLEGHVVELPPLRERREDFGLLMATLLRRLGVTERDGKVLPSNAVLRMLAYSWPENIRKFLNCLAESVQLAGGPILNAASFPEPDCDLGAAEKGEDAALSDQDKKLRNELIALLDKQGGNVSEVAAALDMHRAEVYRALARFGLKASSFRR